MAKKSTGVYVVDKFNELYELNEYQIFVQKECAKLQKKNIHISGSGNTLVYIGELWQKKKAKEAAKAERDEKARIRKENDVILTSSTCTYATAAAMAADAKKAEAAAKRKLKKQQEDAENERALKEADEIAERILRERAAAMAAEAKKAEAAAKQKLKKQQEDAENERALKEADAVAERILRERAAEKAKDDERYYTIIQHSNSIISKFNVNNTSYFSNNPTSKRFIGVQV
jgi:hypothetical protein